MSVTAAATGTQTTVLTTEHTLYDTTAAGVFTLHLNKVLMTSGDVIELRIYQMILTATTRQVAYFQRYADTQPVDDIISISVPVANELTDSGALRFTLTQTKGTVHAYTWKVLTY